MIIEHVYVNIDMIVEFSKKINVSISIYLLNVFILIYKYRKYRHNNVNIDILFELMTKLISLHHSDKFKKNQLRAF